MYNKIVLMGNLTRDVEIRYSQGGSAIGNTGIAVNRKWKSKTGEQKEEVMFVDLTFFGRTAEIANQYLRKGAKVLVDGRLSLDQWTSKDGQKRSKHSVIVENLQMLGGRDNNSGANGGYNNPNQGQPQQQNNQYQSNQNQYNNNNKQNTGMQQQQPYNNKQSYDNSQQQPSYQSESQQQPTQQPTDIPSIDINEDEIPF